MHSKTDATVERIAAKGDKHDAYDKHVVKQGEFGNPAYGPPVAINNREDYKRHVAGVLENKDTESFTAHSTQQTHRQADVYYHRTSNTIVIVPKDPQSPATAYRPKNHGQQFADKLTAAQSAEPDRTIEVRRGGIQALHPEPGLQQRMEAGAANTPQARSQLDGGPPPRPKSTSAGPPSRDSAPEPGAPNINREKTR